jgi:hypothetical protein
MNYNPQKAIFNAQNDENSFPEPASKESQAVLIPEDASFSAKMDQLMSVLTENMVFYKCFSSDRKSPAHPSSIISLIQPRLNQPPNERGMLFKSHMMMMQIQF